MLSSKQFVFLALAILSSTATTFHLQSRIHHNRMKMKGEGPSPSEWSKQIWNVGISTFFSLGIGGQQVMASSSSFLAPQSVSMATAQTVSIARGGIPELNSFLQAVKTVKEELQSDRSTNLGSVQKRFDVDGMISAVDGALDAIRLPGDQTTMVAKRKSVDKVLRLVLSDVITIEDKLRDLPPEKIGGARMQKIEKPLTKLETDLGRLTAALTSDDTETAAGIVKPLFALCPDGYLLCQPE